MPSEDALDRDRATKDSKNADYAAGDELDARMQPSILKSVPK